jgi:hypothetical protein
MRKIGLLIVIALVLTVAACKSDGSGGTLTGTVTYAKSADKPLTDKNNVGAPATDVKVRIRLLEQPKQSGGEPIFVSGDALFELTPDAQGKYALELPQSQYLLEIVSADGTVVDKRMILMKAGQNIRADFNLTP